MMEKLKLGKFDSKNYQPIVLFTLVNIILLLWFKDGKLIASGEDGLFFANPQRALDVFSNIWINGLAGFATSDFLPRLPFSYFLYQNNPMLQNTSLHLQMTRP